MSAILEMVSIVTAPIQSKLSNLDFESVAKMLPVIEEVLKDSEEE